SLTFLPQCRQASLVIHRWQFAGADPHFASINRHQHSVELRSTGVSPMPSGGVP
ncbi:hypothetical protein HAX54_052105, partial [Datura stramonium]|nr:hypothetical protein [Datura stramonium]